MSHTTVKLERRRSLEKIFNEHGTRIYNLARRMLHSIEDAEDVTQEVLLKIVQRIGQFRGEAALGTWVYRITVNSALDYRQRRARRPVPLGDPYDEFLPNGMHAQPVPVWREEPHQDVLANEAKELVQRAIAQLPEPYRDVYLLSDVEKLPILEVANLLGLTVPAMKSRLHRARLALRKKLAPYFEESAA